MNELEGKVSDEALFDEGSRLLEEEAAGETVGAGIGAEEAAVGAREGVAPQTLATDPGVLPRHKWHPHTIKVCIHMGGVRMDGGHGGLKGARGWLVIRDSRVLRGTRVLGSSSILYLSLQVSPSPVV